MCCVHPPQLAAAFLLGSRCPAFNALAPHGRGKGGSCRWLRICCGVREKAGWIQTPRTAVWVYGARRGWDESEGRTPPHCHPYRWSCPVASWLGRRETGCAQLSEWERGSVTRVCTLWAGEGRTSHASDETHACWMCRLLPPAVSPRILLVTRRPL